MCVLLYVTFRYVVTRNIFFLMIRYSYHYVHVIWKGLNWQVLRENILQAIFKSQENLGAKLSCLFISLVNSLLTSTSNPMKFPDYKSLLYHVISYPLQHTYHFSVLHYQTTASITKRGQNDIRDMCNYSKARLPKS